MVNVLRYEIELEPMRVSEYGTSEPSEVLITLLGFPTYDKASEFDGDLDRIKVASIIQRLAIKHRYIAIPSRKLVEG